MVTVGSVSVDVQHLLRAGHRRGGVCGLGRLRLTLLVGRRGFVLQGHQHLHDVLRHNASPPAPGRAQRYRDVLRHSASPPAPGRVQRYLQVCTNRKETSMVNIIKSAHRHIFHNLAKPTNKESKVTMGDRLEVEQFALSN